MSLILECCGDEFTTSSILEFLKKEQECFRGIDGDTGNDAPIDDASDLDVESIFDEIHRLSGVESSRQQQEAADRDISEILKEAEGLLNQNLSTDSLLESNKDKIVLETQSNNYIETSSIASEIDDEVSVCSLKNSPTKFQSVVNAVEPDSIISDESTPLFLNNDNDYSDDTDTTMEDIMEGIETINVKEPLHQSNTINSDIKSTHNENIDVLNTKLVASNLQQRRKKLTADENNDNITNKIKPFNNENMSRPSSVQYNNKTNTSKEFISVKTSPIEAISFSREHALKLEIEQLQEKLKDTEERLQSLKIQHNSLSQIHRDLRESNSHLQEESEILKLDVQHLTECANVLRMELQTAKNDRNEAIEIQKTLQSELTDTKIEKKKSQDQSDRDARIIQDLKRQCKEMEKILMRKHPDSVSALIVASKNSSKTNDDSVTRRLLEQRIAQLEQDAKEQDLKAQKILQNVQSKFNSVQSKYEHHIADLETQVLSLQEINTKLNEKIEFQIVSLNNFTKSQQINFSSSGTQTEEFPEHDHLITVNCSTQTDSSRPNSSTGVAKPSFNLLKKSQQAKAESAKEDAHLLATIRGMRVDLAIKDKAMQRLTRELEECKKTIRKLQKEKEAFKHEKPTTSRKLYDPSQYSEQQNNNDSQSLKEALNKIKLLEFDFKSLHDKRLQDLKTLQAAHERELSSCQETVRILQQRLTERDEAFANQKRRKVPIDYYALKAKVTSLERRHSEREQRLHMLVEALSKGRLNGALEELLHDEK